MSENTRWRELIEIIKGFLLLFLCHALVIVIFFLFNYIILSISGNYAYALLPVWILGSGGFFLWQLLYVMPLIDYFKRQGKIGMMKGVIIGAVITALLNGSCFLLINR
jgi:hypothetical protein